MKKKYKRKEGFRFVFNPPLDAQFSVLMNGRRIDHGLHSCKIVDISPRGMKVFTDLDVYDVFTHSIGMLQLEMHFVLDITKIRAIGQVRWIKNLEPGIHFGLHFANQPGIEELIIREMKSRRRKEVFAEKYI